MRWDKERLVEIVVGVGKDENFTPLQIATYGTAVVDKLEKLIEGVRAEAIGWTWVEACSQYNKGLNPGDQLMPNLLAHADLDLNPERK